MPLAMRWTEPGVQAVGSVNDASRDFILFHTAKPALPLTACEVKNLSGLASLRETSDSETVSRQGAKAQRGAAAERGDYSAADPTLLRLMACSVGRLPEVGQIMAIAIQSLHIGMKVSHPSHGVGVVKALTEHTADISFDDGPRSLDPASSDLTSAEATASLRDLQLPLTNLIRDVAEAVVGALGLERKDALVEGLANRWQNGTLILRPGEASLQPKEVPLETFFHKIVMIRNNLRVLEQKVNGNEKLSDADKVELQQYITRSYGSLTTFNVLFKDKEDQFSTK